ncbi:MAG: aminotransferase class I/II-fold pyridoxal phosphate-dependent enzyme [Deltaproteobacteria bacterium]|nr:aminotransferase class I/II-fold pyridoxal phosphate-dependent enzyme [Deltaproteobacteria bacterium]
MQLTDYLYDLDTLLVHAGEPRPPMGGAVILPVFQSATFAYPDPCTTDAALRYIRLNNTPNHEVLHAKLAALEKAEAALVTASGMAAIAAVLLTVLGTGDRMMVQEGLYGGTHGLVHQDLKRLGIEADVVCNDDPADWRRRLRPTTRAFYVETITNPTMRVADLEAVAAFSREHGLVSIIDNTFASPVNFRPVEHGFDLSLHSATKYLNGHSDIVAGAVMGRADLVDRVRQRLDHLGAALDPHACFLLHRGLKTLGVRVRQQNRGAEAVARFLAAHPAVTRVNYPGLESHPDHHRARRLFEGYGGMLSFEIDGGVAAAEAFLSRLRLPVVAPSLGGVESLVTRPAATSHAGMSPAARRAMGVSESLVRLSVGIEAPRDLIADLDQALAGR